MKGRERGYCALCGGRSDHRHHIISGTGRRKRCETKESVIDLCVYCHSLVHSAKGADIMTSLKLDLQKQYFDQGRSLEDVRELMGDKLYLKDGQIYGR